MDNNTSLGDSGLLRTALAANASAGNYHAWLSSLAVPYLGSHPLELGSGLGEYAQMWMEQGLHGIAISEIDQVLNDHLQRRFAADPRVRIVDIDLSGQEPGDYTSVVSFNVMEHVPDDRAAFRAAHALLRPGGYVVTFAPAFPCAMSRFDRSIGHVRRYTIASISEGYRDAGFEMVECRYYNAPGLLAWYVGMRLLHLTPKAGPALSLWDSQVIPRVRRWESRRTVPFGQSVFAVGRKR